MMNSAPMLTAGHACVPARPRMSVIVLAPNEERNRSAVFATNRGGAA
jgi:hypothetical protein